MIQLHRHPRAIHEESRDQRTVGQRAADRTSQFVGSWRFVFIYIGLTLGWCCINLATVTQHWDPYPFIFYTFSVSVLAILMSSLILLAGNRQADVDRGHAENAYHHVDEVNAKQDQQLEVLHRQLGLIERQMELIERQMERQEEQHKELHDQLAALMGP